MIESDRRVLQAFRQTGADAVAWIADYLEGLPGQSILPEAEAVLSGDQDTPVEGQVLAEVFERFLAEVVPGLGHGNHPGYLAYFNTTTAPAAIVAEMLAAGINANCMLWRTAPAATVIERQVSDWVREALGLPPEFFGVTMEGGSLSNFHALAAARARASGPDFRQAGAGAGRRLTLYMSAEAHSSIDRAVVTLGLGLDSIRRVECDEAFRMRPDRLEAMISHDEEEGLTPFCVVATLGTTGSAAVDPLAAIARICERRSIWMHVDASHGGAVGLLPEHRGLCDGWQGADSITFNPHKWMFVPLDCSLLYVRDRAQLRGAFSLVPAYLETDEDEINLMDYGLTLGRRFRALKLWFVLRHMGFDAIAGRIRSHLAMAQAFSDWVQTQPWLMLVAAPQLSTVCFAVRAGETATRQLLEQINAGGRAFLSSTRLDGRLVVRVSVSGLYADADTLRSLREVITAAHHSTGGHKLEPDSEPVAAAGV